MNASDGAVGASLERARLLMAHGRHAEAERFLREALAQDPSNAAAHYLLACCIHSADGREKEALEVIDRAVALEPEWPVVQARRSIFLAGMKRWREAHESADRALTLDPDDAFAHAAKAYAFMRESRWADAETQARRALALDADDSLARNVLSQALLWQGKGVESREDIAARLARDPEDEMTHFNAGYAALRAGQFREGEAHFLEALRLDPSFDGARQGLLECFRARSFVYRSYLQYSFAMARLSEKGRTVAIIVIYLGYSVARRLAHAVSPALGKLLVLLYFLFVTWTYVGRGVGNLVVLCDRRARCALNRREKWEGLLVGGGVVVGLLLALAGFAFRLNDVGIAGLCLLGPAIPLSLTLSNDNRTGIRLYGALAAVTVVCALVVLAHLIPGSPVPDAVADPALAAGSTCVAVATLLGAFHVKYE